jgi:hypothetical protein
MKQMRIACLTYKKFPGDDWREEEFTERKVELNSGNTVKMKIAERGVILGKIIWAREVRKLSDCGHQTAIISTDYTSDLAPIAARMFARWSQENFFKYMREHFNLDRLTDYNLEDIPDAVQVVNPDYRRLDGEVRKKVGTLNRSLTKFGQMQLEGEIETDRFEQYQQKKSVLQDEISELKTEIEKLKIVRKSIKHHINFSQLPEQERFKRLSTPSKHLIDTIKMIAYRTETACANLIRLYMTHKDQARSLIRALYSAQADLIPDDKERTLTIRLHHLANRSEDEAIRCFCDELNATENTFPGTNLKMIYQTVSKQNP